MVKTRRMMMGSHHSNDQSPAAQRGDASLVQPEDIFVPSFLTQPPSHITMYMQCIVRGNRVCNRWITDSMDDNVILLPLNKSSVKLSEFEFI